MAGEEAALVPRAELKLLPMQCAHTHTLTHTLTLTHSHLLLWGSLFHLLRLCPIHGGNQGNTTSVT